MALKKRVKRNGLYFRSSFKAIVYLLRQFFNFPERIPDQSVEHSII